MVTVTVRANNPTDRALRLKYNISDIWDLKPYYLHPIYPYIVPTYPYGYPHNNPFKGTLLFGSLDPQGQAGSVDSTV